DIARRVGPAEELLRAGRARGEEEERGPDRTALTGRAVLVGRVRGARRRDRRALRRLDVGECGGSDAGRRVEPEDRRGGPALEVADEREEAVAHLLLPRDVRHV